MPPQPTDLTDQQKKEVTMLKYKVTMDYSFQVTKEVEAPNPEEALVAPMGYGDFLHQMWTNLADGESKVELIEE